MRALPLLTFLSTVDRAWRVPSNNVTCAWARTLFEQGAGLWRNVLRQLRTKKYWKRIYIIEMPICTWLAENTLSTRLHRFFTAPTCTTCCLLIRIDLRDAISRFQFELLPRQQEHELSYDRTARSLHHILIIALANHRAESSLRHISLKCTCDLKIRQWTLHTTTTPLLPSSWTTRQLFRNHYLVKSLQRKNHPVPKIWGKPSPSVENCLTTSNKTCSHPSSFPLACDSLSQHASSPPQCSSYLLKACSRACTKQPKGADWPGMSARQRPVASETGPATTCQLYHPFPTDKDCSFHQNYASAIAFQRPAVAFQAI